jgi:hypothetical protein
VEPGSRPCPRGGEVGKTFREDSARAVSDGAEEAADAQLQVDGAALPGEVFESAAVTAVDALRRVSASRAARRAGDCLKDKGDGVRLEDDLLKL